MFYTNDKKINKFDAWFEIIIWIIKVANQNYKSNFLPLFDLN